MIKREAKVHMLPTTIEYDKNLVSRLAKKWTGDEYVLAYEDEAKPWSDNWRPKHLYITTDEEIKEGDWFINTGSGGHPTPKVYQANSENSKAFKEFGPYPEIRKIIATTDPKLSRKRRESNPIKSVAEIPQSFIEEYCKAGGIDEVLVEYYDIEMCFNYNGAHFGKDCSCKGGDFRRIPKLDNNCIIIHPVEGKMYTLDDVKQILVDYSNDLLSQKYWGSTADVINKWIEEKL